MNPKMTGKYLITTDAWFYCPDGKRYNAVYGNVEILSDEILGIKTNARSSNWFAKVGNKNEHVIIAGCQIHYSVKCAKINTSNVLEFDINNGEVKHYERETMIYVFEDVVEEEIEVGDIVKLDNPVTDFVLEVTETSVDSFSGKVKTCDEPQRIGFIKERKS